MVGLTKLGIENHTLQFEGKCHELKGFKDTDDPMLAIGGFELAFLANLIESFVVEKTCRNIDTNFKSKGSNGKRLAKKIHMLGFCRDDGILAAKGKHESEETGRLLEKLDAEADKTFDCDGALRFKMEVWDGSVLFNHEVVVDEFKVVEDADFPFLDARVSWRLFKRERVVKWINERNHCLENSICRKPNEFLKFLNASSTHEIASFQFAPKGEFHRLASLASTLEVSNFLTMDVSCLQHFKALKSQIK